MFVGEVVVQNAVGEAGGAGDVAARDRIGSSVGEQRCRGIDEASSHLGGADPSSPGAASGWRWAGRDRVW